MIKEKILTGFLKNIKLASTLRYAYYTQREIERQIKISLKNNLSFSREIIFSNEKNSFLESLKENFFSLLMLSTLKNIGITHARVKEYGKIIFGLRTIITCTNNITDHENNGIISLNSPNHLIVNNTLLLMIGQDIVKQSLVALEDKKGAAMNRILENIYSITSSKSLRNLEKYSVYPNPEYVSQNIHKGIGGELLALAFTAPILLEDDPHILEKLQLSKDALFTIGNALQKLNDLCNIEDDFNSKKVNLAISILYHEYDFHIGNHISKIKPEKKEFQNFYKEYIGSIVKKTFEGFVSLEHTGYPLKKEDVSILLKDLFILKNLQNYWKFYDDSYI